jgi:hypothetical protein
VSLRAIFYATQFDREPIAAIDRIVDTLLPRGMLGITKEELLTLINDELKSGRPLVRLDMSAFQHSEETLRAFVLALRDRLTR